MSTKSARVVPLKHWKAVHDDALTPGQKAADRLRNVMGSWGFIGGFVGFMGLWALANSFASGWDPYPFILLNLFLSMLAGLQGAILLISAKRQDAIAAALAQHDYDTNVAAKIDVEQILKINVEQTQLLAELRELLREQRAPQNQG